MTRRVLAAGGVTRDGAGRVLLVLRRNPPEAGRWSVPGGRVEPGETIARAVVREVREETGLDVVTVRELGTIDLPAGQDTVYECHDVLAQVVGGVLTAGDDALDVRWVTRSEACSMPLTDRLIDILDGYGVFGAGIVGSEP